MPDRKARVHTDDDAIAQDMIRAIRHVEWLEALTNSSNWTVTNDESERSADIVFAHEVVGGEDHVQVVGGDGQILEADYVLQGIGEAYKFVEMWLSRYGAQLDNNALRGVIEALHRTVQMLVVENDDLLQLLNDYADQVDHHKGELTEAQIEVRTLRAVLEQVRGFNETLLLELSKRRVDKETASLTVRAMKKAVDYAMVGAITMGATYAGTIAAQPTETLAKVDAARAEVVIECAKATAALDPTAPQPNTPMSIPSEEHVPGPHMPDN